MLKDTKETRTMLKLADIYRAVTDNVRDPFPTDVRGLPAAGRS